MNKIFGYTKKGGQHWFSSDAYSDKEIDSIKDPEGGSEISLPTAIPSPFARIDLVKSAFRNITKSHNLKAYTNNCDVIAGRDDEKLVSDALDLAEMLFNFDSIKDKIRIIVWDRNLELENLKNSSKKGHRQLAETLELYLDQDKESYNFELLKRLYLIEYDHKIIGCTSPVTMFFATANDLSHAQIKLTGNDLTFDNEYAPLYKREAEFQKYFYLLFKANPILSQHLTVINDYLEKNLKILDIENHKLYEEIKNLNTSSFINNYSELDTGTSGNLIEIIGVALRKRKKEDIINSIQSSDFIIQSSKYKGDLKPLVLQNNLTKSLRYANDYWDNTIKIPFKENEHLLEKRWLPGVRIQYPYLTVSDFLEPYLIRLVYPINKDKFFDGNVVTQVGDDSKGFILPLKKQFFDYFNSDDLISSLPNKPKIEMVQGTSGSVKVILKIPVAKYDEYITFERIYYQSPENQIGTPDEEVNKGVIVEHQFGVTLFPFIKTNNENIEPFYRVQLIDRDVAGVFKNTDYDLKFFSNANHIEVSRKAKQIRRKKNSDQLEAGSQYYVLEKEFDFIQINNSIASGIIIPRWQTYSQGNEVFSFAVDFGTTNTHIEYKIGNGGSPKPFDITFDDVQIATLFHPTKTTTNFGGTDAIDIRELIDHEFVPQYLGNGLESKYRFPQRTVIAESHSLNIETETFSLADFNIPFIYERIPEKDKIQSNLKWAKKEKGNEKRITAYFEKIIMLLRNKVLFNKGNLSQTKLVWFYPSSMKPARKSQLENTWNELFNKYFRPSNQAIGITESLAPFYYFKGTNKLKGGSFKPVISIDIGGGTTDIVVFKSNKPLLLTSFKFAANAIFGDGFSEYGAANSNGLINKYYNHYQNLFDKNSLPDLLNVLASIKEKNKTEDLNAFFFSIENNPIIKDKKLFSYNSLLTNDEDLKIIFIYFYSAIIYHIADLMKKKQIELPKHIVFSGTGSKVLNIITSDLKILANLSKIIFESVYSEKFDSDGLSIETEKEMPKEVTCKGGLMLNTEDLDIDIRTIKATNTCLKGVDKLKYVQLDETAKSNISIFVKDFNNFFFNLNSQYSFTDYFNVTTKSIEIFKDELSKNLRGYLDEGLEFNKKLDEIDSDDKEIEETLFFYPIIGAINNLTSHLSQLSQVNN
jgi:hypothetical protein